MQEVSNDFKYASSIEASNLFQKLHLQEYEQAGGEPFGLLLMDFSMQLQDVELLENFMKIAQHAFLPMLYNITEPWCGLEAPSLQRSRPVITLLEAPLAITTSLQTEQHLDINLIQEPLF